MALNNFPTIIGDILQTNLLETKFQDELEAINAYMSTAYRLPLPTRSGETMIYSRGGKLTPVLDDITPSSNVAPDNGATGIGGIGAANPTIPFEQWLISIGMTEYYLDLNIVQAPVLIADLFKKNVRTLAEQAVLSMDLKARKAAFGAYLSGSSFVTKVTGSVPNGTLNSGTATALFPAVDNILGLNTAFAQVLFGATYFSHGQPQPVSGSFPLAITVTHLSDGTQTFYNVTSAGLDSVNASSMAVGEIGYSGMLGLANLTGSATALAIGDTIAAFDAPAVYRPNGKLNQGQLALTDTMGAQLIINAVAELTANGVRSPLANGTYPCYIDPIVMAQFFADPQFQIMAVGQYKSDDFRKGVVNDNFGVTFVPTTNSPVFAVTNNSVNLKVRQAIITGEKYLQYSPFDGTQAALASMPDMGVADYRFISNPDIVLVTRMPLDRAGQIISQGWWQISGFVAPTDATITTAVIPSSTPARYKRAVVIQVASAR